MKFLVFEREKKKRISYNCEADFVEKKKLQKSVVNNCNQTFNVKNTYANKKTHCTENTDKYQIAFY